MNICVTGALGHIGSALIRNISTPLIKKVYLVDNFLTQRYASLFNLPYGINYSFHELDILSEDMGPIIEDSDVLIHLAAVTNAEKSFHDSELVEKINKKGLENVASLCSQHDCALVFPSSTSVYGVQEGVVDENCKEKDLMPQSPYAESKIYGEKLLARLSKEKGLRFVIFRLATIFGYSIGMRFHTAVNKFIWQASLGQDITVWKTALNQKRPYCDLQDAVSAFNQVVEKNMFDREIYNVVTMNLTVADIVASIRQYIPELKFKFVESAIMNQLSYNVSNEKSIKAGFKYSGDLDVSIKESLKQIKNINASNPKIDL